MTRWGAERWLPAFCISAALVFIGGAAGPYYIVASKCAGHFFGFGGWYANWDGQWYNMIARDGYAYNDSSDPYSPVVFFPLYPLLGIAVHTLLHVTFPISLMIVSLASLAACCGLFWRYAALRLPEAPAHADAAVLFFLFWPASYFARLNYTESLFALLVAALLYGFIKQWPTRKLIGVSGLACMLRPPGIICALAVGYHVWLRHAEIPLPKRLLQAAAAAAASAWGLYAYMLYLWLQFGDPLLFFEKQRAWVPPGAPAGADMALSLVIFKPLWSFFTGGAWRDPIAYSWVMENKSLWVIQMGLTAWGTAKRWLTREEVFLSLGLLLLAYIANGAGKDMMSVGRYGLMVLPCYLVLARLLAPRGMMACACFIGVCAAFLFSYAALFAKAHCVN